MSAKWGKMGLRQGPGHGQDGFAAVDALVAVTILASSLALSLMAAQIGARASRTADQTRDAELLLRGRLETTGGQAGVWRGTAKGLAWKVEANRSSDDPVTRAAPCLRTASAVAGGRTYRIVTVDTCQAEASR